MRKPVTEKELDADEKDYNTENSGTEEEREVPVIKFENGKKYIMEVVEEDTSES